MEYVPYYESYWTLKRFGHMHRHWFLGYIIGHRTSGLSDGSNSKLFSVISAPSFLSLGMIEDYELDTSPIPDDGSLKQVEITITELSFNGIDPSHAASKSSARLFEIKEA